MIRIAKLVDKDDINNLGQLINSNYKKLFKIDDILNTSYSKIYVYEDNKKVVGFIHLNVLYENIDIINIVVDPFYRRCNIGTKLLKFIIDEYKKNIANITLEVDVGNIAAINLYKKFGFEIINIRKNYYCNKDAYLMERKLGQWKKIFIY